MLALLSALRMQVDMQLLINPWQNLEHATQTQFADPKLKAAVNAAVKKLHAINNCRDRDIRRPNLIFR